MEAFPSPLESTVASALLLLATTTSPPVESKNVCSEQSLAVSNSKSRSNSSVTSSGEGSSAKAPAHCPLRIATVVGRCHEKLKVVRKSRSKNLLNSDKKNFSCLKSVEFSSASESKSTEASSCLSSSSGAVSSPGSGAGKQPSARGLKRKPPTGSARMGRRADAIMRLLSEGCASEVRIRQLLGDSPDTSKALRMLLKEEEIKRSGKGGRGDPYIYMIA
ncbi:uncharacterized protein LOC127788223 [Diospyros lotus]|uniref:uncharacterized protein LOC127788223 n=1 Tax=Diospyros lotus TaxID=55363 RepID=UPI00224D1926|nr:uncharacterized protein LOC127788223 [Diospyros lotus]